MPSASVSLSPSFFAEVLPAFVEVLPPDFDAVVPPRFPEERLTDFVEPDGFFVVLSFPVPEPLPEDTPALSFCSYFNAFSSTL